MLRLSPRSIATTCRSGDRVGFVLQAPSDSLKAYGSFGVTRFTRSCPSIDGASRAFRTRTSGAAVPMAPFCEPWSRKWRVKARVSMPVMATMPWRARYWSSVSVAR